MQTIKDVAALAGVSDKTVSRVVNGEPNVSKKTKDRVDAAIAALQYIPNHAARLVRTNRSGVIGLMTDVVATTPNSVEIIRGIQDRVSAARQSLLIANTSGEVAEEQRVWRTFQEHRIDGVIFATMYHREIDFAPPPTAMPIVLVNCTARGRTDVPAIVPDDYQGGYSAARFALERGHRRIGYVTLNPAILAAHLRGSAFATAMGEAGVAIRDDWVRPGYRGAVGEEEICGYDVAIIGFDDFRKISTQVVPQLTTIALPYYDIGVRAAEKLLGVLAGTDDGPMIERLECPVIRRRSA